MSWNLKDLEKSLLIGSTLVEGSMLSEREAESILAGRTVQGHPVREVRELLNYRSSVEWLIRELNRSPYLSKDILLQFHQRLFQGFPGEHGRWKTLPNYTYQTDGSRFDYCVPEEVNRRMREWIETFNHGDVKANPSSKLAAQLYYSFQEIHPFEDGNGRIGRILIAYWLHWKARCAFSFRLKDKVAHLKALESANQGDRRPLEDFFKQRMRREK